MDRDERYVAVTLFPSVGDDLSVSCPPPIHDITNIPPASLMVHRLKEDDEAHAVALPRTHTDSPIPFQFAAAGEDEESSPLSIGLPISRARAASSNLTPTTFAIGSPVYGSAGRSQGERLRIMPQTPIKKHRTVHAKDDRLVAKAARTVSLRQGAKFMRAEAKHGSVAEAQRRRISSDVMSQFSAMDLEDVASHGAPHTTRGGGGAQTPTMAPMMGGPPLSAFSPARPSPAMAASPSWPDVSRSTGFPAGSFSQMLRPSQDVLELSQADTEYSNLFARRILTDYREVRELGKGSFGRVHLYEAIATGEPVAIKSSQPLYSPEQTARCRRERDVMLLLHGQPHVVQLSAWWEEGRIPQMFLELEYCPGGSVAALAERRRERGEAWEADEVGVFLLHMAIALDAMHRRNIAHVDFKPDNVLIDRDGNYRLSDFGCSVLLDDLGRPRRIPQPSTNKGLRSSSPLLPPRRGGGISSINLCWDSIGSPSASTPCRPSPGTTTHDPLIFTHPDLSLPVGLGESQLSMASVDEGDCRYLCMDMLNEKRYCKAGDLYSLGMSLIELLSGEALPRQGEAFHHLRRNPPLQLFHQRGCPSSLVGLIGALVREDPTSRPTAREVLQLLRPPPEALMCISDELQIATLTSGRKQLHEALDKEEESTSTAHLRFVAATVEGTSWLLHTALQELAHSGHDGSVFSPIGTPTPAATTTRARAPLPSGHAATPDAGGSPLGGSSSNGFHAHTRLRGFMEAGAAVGATTRAELCTPEHQPFRCRLVLQPPAGRLE